MKIKALKDFIHNDKIIKCGETAEIEDVTFYVLENRGIVEKVNVMGDVVTGLPPLNDEPIKKAKK